MSQPHFLPVGLALALCALLVAGCATGPSRSPTGPAPAGDRDGPEANPPADLAGVPDAQPRVEPIRNGGPNKPYEVLGRSYTPITQDRAVSERGLASWYGRKFHGRRTASGEVYNMYAMTAAHPTLPIPSYARIRNPANGREVVVRVNDRGPFHAGRIVDLSYTAALKLDLLRNVAPVELERITFDEIRSGAWQRGVTTGAAAAAAPNDATPSPPADSGTTASVAAVPIEDTAPARALTTAARGFWVQLGAFRQRDGAEVFQRRVVAEVEWIAPMLAVFNDGKDAGLFRLQAGPYPSRDEARASAERIRDALQLVPLIVERR